MTFYAGLLGAAGLTTALAGAANWGWFMDHPKAELVVSVFGRGGARLFYIVLGIGILWAAATIEFPEP